MPKLPKLIALLLAAVIALAACGNETTLTGDARVVGANDSQQAPTALPALTAPTASADPEPAAAPTAIAAQSESDSESLTAVVTSQDDDAVEADTGDQTVSVGGASATLSNIAFEVGETVSRRDDQPALIVQLSLDHLDVADWLDGLSFGRSIDVILEDPTGRPIGREDMRDHTGDRVSSLGLTGKGHHELFIEFETPAPVTDVAGWNLVIASGNALGVQLPLVGLPYATDYPLSLRSGDEGQAQVEVRIGCDDGVVVDTIIDRAFVDVESSGDPRDIPEPANPGFRWLAIDLAVADTSPLERNEGGPYYCGDFSLWPDFLLSVDGTTIAADLATEPDFEVGASAVVVLGFWIPVEASEVALRIDDAGSNIASWNLDLPLVPGEDGAELVRSGSSKGRPELATGLSPVPDQPTVTDLGVGAASDRMLHIDYTLQSAMATNTKFGPGGTVGSNAAVHPEGRAFAMVSFVAESTAEASDRYSLLSDDYLSLNGPDGRSWPIVELYDGSGEEESRRDFDGRDSETFTAVFETHGLVTDPTGWSLEINNGVSIPVILPLVGPADLSHTFELPAGANRIITRGDSNFCNGGTEMDARVERAGIGLEGDGWIRWTRARPGMRIVNVELQLEHVDPNPDRRGAVNYCGWLSQWPDFRVVADGRAFASLDNVSGEIESFATDTVSLSFAIPEATRTLELYGGVAPTLITGWELRDNAAVLTELEAVEEDERTLITLDESVLFAFGESSLQREAEAPLTRLAAVLTTGSEGTIDLLGHTDAIGDDASNQQLSEARAQAVADFLVSAGVDGSRLVVAGAGETQPVAPNTNDDGSDNPDGRAQNRRVEVRFTATS